MNNSPVLAPEYSEGFAEGEAYVQSLHTNPNSRLTSADVTARKNNDNPYEQGTQQYSLWRDGWNDGYDSGLCTGDDSQE
jgi:hypothetical protein